MLKIYNSLTKNKDEFKPIVPGKVGIYVCGVTVYDYCHLGHARMLVAFDTIVRHLRFSGLDVNYVRNITDIDDKIIARAKKNGEAYNVLTERFTNAMHEDLEKLNVLAPDHEPCATDHIAEIITLTETLIEKGIAYVASNGDVYYKVDAFPDYGKLSHKHLDDLVAGARIEISDVKESPLDFVLWKMAKPDEPAWDSPWGKGRPGWHIECSAMSMHSLGEHFDIHGGGLDLKFPHHENEVAQSEAATGKTFVNYWIHNGFVQINQEKMSKSLGNFFTIREVLEKYRPEVIRYLMVSSHYRSPINFSQESLNFAQGALDRLYTALRGLPDASLLEDSDYDKRFVAAMDDDFNTAEALAVLFDITHEINRLRSEDLPRASALGALLKHLGGVLGLLDQDPDVYLQSFTDAIEINCEQIDMLIKERVEARTKKDWAASDRIRDELLEMGIVLEDGASGTTWRRV